MMLGHVRARDFKDSLEPSLTLSFLYTYNCFFINIPLSGVLLAETGAVDMQDEVKIKHIRRAYACSAFDRP